MSDDMADYEAKRQRRVEENKQKLLALNIPSIPRPVRHPISRKTRDATPLHPVRRSLRIRNQESSEPHQMKLKQEEEDTFPIQKSKRAKVEPPPELNLPTTNIAESFPTGKKQHVSSSQLEIELDKFHSKCLGTQLLPMGKQTVMQALCRPGYMAKFSKMSGVQPWRNAVVLFVNVESDSPYDNVFRQEQVDGETAVHFQWFGQGRWNDESPMVLRLRKMQRGDERLCFDDSYHDKVDEKEVGKEPLLLFLRHSQGPYIYCGRLGYLGYRPLSKPLEFRWQLLDVGSLEWEKIRELLAASDPSKKMDGVSAK